MLNTFLGDSRAAFQLCLRMNSLIIIAAIAAGCASSPPSSSIQPVLQSLRMEARQALDKGDMSTALVNLRKAQAAEPSDLETLRLIARLYSEVGDSAAQLATAELIAELDSNDVPQRVWLGLNALRNGQLVTASDYLKQALALDPALWEAHNGLGIVADAEGRYADAQRHFQRGLEIIPGHPKLTANLGWSHVLSGNLAQAETLLRQALRTAPDRLVTQSNLAFCVALQGRYEESLALYRQIYDEATAANNLGYAAMTRGDHARAERYLTQAISRRASFYGRAAHNLSLNELSRADQDLRLRSDALAAAAEVKGPMGHSAED